MEQGREKKNPQAIPNNLMQQKVFKFHNVSKDIILGNKKAKKDAKKKAKSVPSHVISTPEDDSKEKMAHLIFKQFIPIRKKCLPAEQIQTKSNKEKESTKMAKKSFLTSCSKSLQFEIKKKESIKIQEIHESAIQSMSEPTNEKANQTEKPSFIRVVDISSLKEPSHHSGNDLFAKNTVSDQTFSTIFKCNSLEAMHHLDDTSTHLSRMVFPNDEEEAPLDLSKKGQPPEPPNKEQYPLDLSNKCKKYNHISVGEPPPLMPIHIIPKNSLNTFSPDMSTANNLNNSSELVENFVEAKSNDQTRAVNYSNNPSLNKENLVIPPILNLQPIQLVFKTNPVLQTVCKETIINTNKPSPAIQNVPTDYTKELIRTKLREKSMNNPTPETHISEVSNAQSNPVQPIQMVFTGGQFLQVLPSQNIQENVQPVCENLNTNIAPTKTDEIKIVKTRKKRIPAGEPKGSLKTMFQQVSTQNIHQNKRLKIEHINEKSHKYKNKGNNHDTTKDLNQNLLVQNARKTRMLESASFQTPSSMIKTNKTVTSNGGVFCTFKNVKRMKMIKMETKTRRKKSKPDQSNVMNKNI